MKKKTHTARPKSKVTGEEGGEGEREERREEVEKNIDWTWTSS